MSLLAPPPLEVRSFTEAQRRLATLAARAAAHLLGLPQLTVRFFRRDESKQAAGDAALDMLGRKLGLREVGGGWMDDTSLVGLARGQEPGVVWLNADLPPLELVHTLAHEARHRRQYQRGVMDGNWRREQAAADADRWAGLFVTLLAAAGR